MNNTIVLASASPQRKTLLEGLGVSFTVCPSDVDESICTELDPAKKSMILAQKKAQSVASAYPDAYIIGCDTLVVSEDRAVLEKPIDASHAREMIESHSNSSVIVHSGLCVISPEGNEKVDISSSIVHFKDLSKSEIDWWIDTGLWEGRSGSFQIDGKGQMMISGIEGDWTSIVGLPVFLLSELLLDVGLDLKLDL